MSAELILAVFSALLSALGTGGIVSSIVTRRLQRIDKKQEQREEARITEHRLMYWGVRAGGELAKQCALAWQRGKANGALDNALGAYDEYERERAKYLEKQASISNHG